MTTPQDPATPHAPETQETGSDPPAERTGQHRRAARTPSTEKTPSVGMRVDAARRDEFDALRPLYTAADGANGTRSDVLRAMVDIGFAIVGDPKVHERLKRDAAAQGLSPGELLRQRMKTAGALK